MPGRPALVLASGRRARRASACGAALLGLIAIFAPSQARAYEDQLALGLDLGYAIAPLSDAPIPDHGAAAGLSLQLGLNDMFALGVRLGYAIHPGDTSAHVLTAGLEAVYVVDILEVVPFFGLGVDFFGTVQDEFRPSVGVHGVLGIDWLFARGWALGVDVRPYWLPLDAALTVDPFYLQIGLRLSALIEI